jgi:ParB family chromosome partitioning protein
VAEGVSEDAARRIADMKKPDMAQTAEQLLAGSGWLPAIMRTPMLEAAQAIVAEGVEGVEGVEQPSEAIEGEAAYAVAAE